MLVIGAVGAMRDDPAKRTQAVNRAIDQAVHDSSVEPAACHPDDEPAC